MIDGLSPEELADLLGLSLRSLRTWKREHKGPTAQMVGNKLVYPIRNVVRWLRRHDPGLLASVPELERRAKGLKAESEDSKAWKEFFEDTTRINNGTYDRAEDLEDAGDHAGADRVLAESGLSKQDIAHWRKAHAAHKDFVENVVPKLLSRK